MLVLLDKPLCRRTLSVRDKLELLFKHALAGVWTPGKPLGSRLAVFVWGTHIYGRLHCAAQ